MVVVAVGCGWGLGLKNRGPENIKLRAENANLAKERDTANWQLDTSVTLLAKRGITLKYRSNAVFVDKRGIMKKKPNAPEDGMPHAQFSSR